MPKAKAAPEDVRDKYIKVQLNDKEVKYLDALLEVEGDRDKSNLVRRIIFDRYKQKIMEVHK